MKEKKWRNISWPQVIRAALRGLPEWKLKYGKRPRHGLYEAEGGPLDGRVLQLVDGSTAPLRFRDGTRGKYFCGIVAGKSKRRSLLGTTVWRATQ